MKGIEPTADQIERLTAFFLPHCEDKSTLNEIRVMASDCNQWCHAHELFQRIRDKTLRARSERLEHQYCFEEICAKTLYNQSGVTGPFSREVPAPFDDDSALYVGPVAKGFATYLQLEVPELITSMIES